MVRWTQGLAWGTLGVGVIVAGLALARGRDNPIDDAPSNSGGSWFASPERSAPVRSSRGDDGEDRSVHRKRVAYGASRGGARSGGAQVCVRLCDGSFFPAAVAGAGDAGCAAQCPEAPTELYSMTSDRIEDAVSARTGVPYTQLPVAKRFQTLHEATCSCHRDPVASRAPELLHDTTLRKGDVVMTATGFKVFEGAGWGPTSAQDFVSVAKAGVSKAESEQLTAMEHASAGPTLVSGPSLYAHKPKGVVTVDDGPR